MINKDGGGGQFFDFIGGTAVMMEDIELMEGPPSPPPPTRRTLIHIPVAVTLYVNYLYTDNCYSYVMFFQSIKTFVLHMLRVFMYG